MLEDLLEALRVGIERKQAASLLRTRIDQRDTIARALAQELDRLPFEPNVRALATGFGVPQALVRNALAVEIAGCRMREIAARATVIGGAP